MLPPIPCAHCGTNFMRHNIDPEAPRLCNNCELKEKNKPRGNKDMSDVNILFNCDRKTQIEIEEHCTNVGISISQYLNGLHRQHFDALGCAPVKDAYAVTEEKPKVVERQKPKVRR